MFFCFSSCRLVAAQQSPSHSSLPSSLRCTRLMLWQFVNGDRLIIAQKNYNSNLTHPSFVLSQNIYAKPKPASALLLPAQTQPIRQQPFPFLNPFSLSAFALQLFAFPLLLFASPISPPEEPSTIILFLNRMGSVLSNPKVNPSQPQASCKPASIFTANQQVSRCNFKLLRKLSCSGAKQQAVLWLASNVCNPRQTFFLKQYDKAKVYNLKRLQPVLDELALLTRCRNPHFLRPYFAFQDTHSLYLVTEAIDSVQFSQLIGKKFAEPEAKYVIFALISVIEELHKRGFAFTELSPRNLHVNRQTGQIKLVEILNPAKADAYYNSCAASQVSPYSAPEILLRHKVHPHCDYYSLGIIIYEMMTQDLAFPRRDGTSDESSECELSLGYDRSSLLAENIEVEKSKIPEEWQPQSADFLIKLLIKNPDLRLGRYGSFQVKSHPWLKESSEHTTRKRIDITDFQPVPAKTQQAQLSEHQAPEKHELAHDYFFQHLFEGYHYNFRSEQQRQEAIKAQHASKEQEGSKGQHASKEQEGSEWVRASEKRSSLEKKSLFQKESKFRMEEL